MAELEVNLVIAYTPELGLPRTWVAQPVSLPPPWPLGAGETPWEAFYDLLGQVLRCQGCEDAPIGQHSGPHDWEALV